MDLIFCVLTYAIIYVLIHQIIFRFYLFNNILYFFKYSCTNIFHRRSLYTLYMISKQTFLKALSIQILVMYILWIVCKINAILSIMSFAIYGAACFQLTHVSLKIVSIFVLPLIINIKSEVWIISRCLALGHDTLACTVCLAIFWLNFDGWYQLSSLA